MNLSLDPIQLLALAKAVELRNANDEAALPPGTTATVDFVAHIKGDLSRGPSSDRAGVNHARSAGAMCMLLVLCGVTREHSPAQLIETWASFGSLDKKAMAARVASLTTEQRDLYNECMELFQTKIVAALPRIPAKGYVKFKGEVTEA
jgi:hypothetical protein